ncbi:hypothetical protein CIHG_08967 [Coccidioides immitis H538.4]|uniref:Uncharacterized protein n=2 Tax=Coccidioides immitis TaxID=5501 RepID=A0A0J8S0T0_COCIT|nr:hypothetical protein CIRG_04055 [Coccidioides immitis RMSCC 2394]KMU91030.1 hypothetical protein CIHG_08967 [Coccidioides immitis H538.4]
MTPLIHPPSIALSPRGTFKAKISGGTLRSPTHRCFTLPEDPTRRMGTTPSRRNRAKSRMLGPAGHAVYIQPATQGHFPHPQKIYFGKDNRKSRRQIAATLSVECECSAVRASYSTASSFAQLTLSKTRTQGAIIGLVEQKAFSELRNSTLHVRSPPADTSSLAIRYRSDFAVLRPSASSFGSHAGFGVNLMSIDGATNVFQAYAMLQSIQ